MLNHMRNECSHNSIDRCSEAGRNHLLTRVKLTKNTSNLRTANSSVHNNITDWLSSACNASEKLKMEEFSTSSAPGNGELLMRKY